jgi:hypothetical protein
LREAATNAVQLDIQVYSEISKLHEEFDASYARLSDEEPEPWYMDGLTNISTGLEHAEHVVSEEKRGLYDFGWPWEESIAEWTRVANTILGRLPQ